VRDPLWDEVGPLSCVLCKTLATENAAAKKEFLELAEACEEAADKIDDCRGEWLANPVFWRFADFATAIASL